MYLNNNNHTGLSLELILITDYTNYFAVIFTEFGHSEHNTYICFFYTNEDENSLSTGKFCMLFLSVDFFFKTVTMQLLEKFFQEYN